MHCCPSLNWIHSLCLCHWLKPEWQNNNAFSKTFSILSPYFWKGQENLNNWYRPDNAGDRKWRWVKMNRRTLLLPINTKTKLNQTNTDDNSNKAENDSNQHRLNWILGVWQPGRVGLRVQSGMCSEFTLSEIKRTGEWENILQFQSIGFHRCI